MTHKVGTALLTAIDAGTLAPTVAPDDPAFWLLAAEAAARPDRAERLLQTADDLTSYPDELSPLVERIRARLGDAAIRIDGDVLTIDLSRGVPHLDDAVEAVERMLLDAAMKRGDYVQRRAAGLLGISPTRALYLRRKLAGELPTASARRED